MDTGLNPIMFGCIGLIQNDKIKDTVCDLVVDTVTGKYLCQSKKFKEL